MRSKKIVRLTLSLILLLTAAALAPAQKKAARSPQRAKPPAAQPAIVRSYIDAASTIIETSIATGEFQKLVSAIKFAEMVETLKGNGPFTLFAPTDEAFAQLPKDRSAALLADKEKMRSFLSSLVVRGKVMAADRAGAQKPVKEFPDVFGFQADTIVSLGPATSLNGVRLAIRSQGGSHTLGGAKITRTDILCTNGIIHVIDAIDLR